MFLMVFFINEDPKIDFTSQVKPIINKNCISCHGGVKQQGGFSLLFRDEAMAKTNSGKAAIIPGDPDNSEMIRRLSLDDPEERMPYHHPALSEDEIGLLTRWVKEGAVWGNHWAYISVSKPNVPELASFFGLFSKKSTWAFNEVDNFIEDKWKEAGLTATPEADKQTLLRRVSLDLIGMPAPSSIANAYLNDRSKKAYDNLVNSLLASPHYGEKWASLWMDLARYADTKGYERDDPRSIWKYRDWLINAFNNDMPYNGFLVKQLAGDLLPNATEDDQIATAFQRNTMTNDEGGTDREEFRTAAVMDRVNTVWEATMSTTFACVQCHSHPYDPFKHDEYYKFLAFYNNTRDEDTQADYPLLRHFSAGMKDSLKKLETWVKNSSTPEEVKKVTVFLKTWQPTYNSLLCDSFINSSLEDNKWLLLRNNSTSRLKNVYLNNNKKITLRYEAYVEGGILQIHTGHPKGPIIGNIPLKKSLKGWELYESDIVPVKGLNNLYFTYTNNSIKNPNTNCVIFDWFYFTNDLPGADKPGFKNAKSMYWKLLQQKVTTTPIMMDNPTYMSRSTHVFERGNWLAKGAEVKTGIPASLGKLNDDFPKNRLAMANWIISPNNPLTSRTIVNRAWEQLFGIGIVETLEDLGSQGSKPTHKELLDWLSYQFMTEQKWSLKKLLKTLVLSSTYRQDSKLTKELLKKDPENRLYARSPRIRLSAEQIRDQALSISGVMSNKMYGPSVFPYQPKGIWLSPYNGVDWVQSSGEDKYRRAVYTFWKRSAPYPSMLTFDGVSREVCAVRRIRTNTPLQALTTLNDPAYIDIAYHLALKIQKEAGKSIQEQIKKGYQIATYKSISAKSLMILTKLYQAALIKYKQNNPNQHFILIYGNRINITPKLAALTVVSNALLNLDEILTRN